MELPEKTGSSYTISQGVVGELSSRLNIVECENGKSNDKASKKQYDRSGNETSGNAHVTSDHPTSYGETFMHLLRGNIGAGVFGMGDAYKNGGLILAPILTVFIGVISVHCQHVLMDCARKMREIQSNSAEKNVIVEDPDFAETVELCIRNGPPRMRPWSNFFKFMINFFICLTQLGFCCIYFVFIGTNFKQLWNFYITYEYDLFVKICIIFIPILLISMITNLKYLAPLSTIANVCMGTGIALTFYYAFQGLPSLTERRYVGEMSKIPLFFGTAIFAYEGIALVLPLKNAMKKPTSFNRSTGVLNMGMIVVSSLFLTFGFFGYWRWGEEVAGSLTLNLPQSEPLAQTVKLMVSTGLLMTYPLQLFVAVQIMWSAIEDHYGPLKHPLWTQLLFRATMVLLTFCLSEVVPQLNAFISLIGALCSSGLALVFPPIIELVCAWSTTQGPSTWTLTKNFGILLVALFGLLTGTYESLNSLIEAFKKGENEG